MASSSSAQQTGPKVRLENPRVRQLLIVCFILAMLVGTAGQVLMPALGSPFLTWLDTALIPAAIAVLILVNGRDRRSLLLLVCLLIGIEAILTSYLFAIGMAFAILVPIIGIALIQPYVRGRASLAIYAGAGVVATISIALVELGVPANSLERTQPFLTIAAFALVAASALGLLWRASERQVEALDAARREIAARAQAERELSRTTRQMETLIDSSPVATMAFDQAGVVTAWNPAAERLFGWSAGELVDRPWPAGLAAADQLPGLGAEVERIMAGEMIEGDRIETRHRDGHQLLIEIHGNARRDDDSEAVVAVIQAIDVTERAALEAQLREAQRMEAVGQLAGGIAHDINNALTAVGGFAELIGAKSHDQSIRDDAQTISEAVGRARRLTRELLTFAQRSVLQPQVIDIEAFVSSIQPILDGILRPDIELSVRLEAPGARLRVDPGQFERAILNLAVNARDAMPRGGTMTIEATRSPASPVARGGPPRRPPDGGWIVVSVSDNGVGIPPELQDMVFEPFFTTKQRDIGSGLGLAMVYGFVAQSGGQVDLRSTPGVGTTIEIRLPETLEGLSPTPSGTRPMRAAGLETILFVDDDPAVAEFSRTALARLGYKVIIAHDGASAVELAREHPGPIHLLVTDVMMPGLRGPDVARAVQAIHPETRVAYVSGYTADAITERGGLPAGVELIEKPFTAAELGTRIRSILDRTGGGAVSAQPERPAASS